MILKYQFTAILIRLLIFLNEDYKFKYTNFESLDLVRLYNRTELGAFMLLCLPIFLTNVFLFQEFVQDGLISSYFVLTLYSMVLSTPLLAVVVIIIPHLLSFVVTNSMIAVYNFSKIVVLMAKRLFTLFQGLVVIMTLNNSQLSFFVDLALCILSIFELDSGSGVCSNLFLLFSFIKLFLPRILVKCDTTTYYFYCLYSKSDFLKKHFLKILHSKNWHLVTCDIEANDLSPKTIMKFLTFNNSACEMEECEPLLEPYYYFRRKNGINFIRDIGGTKRVNVGVVRDGEGRYDIIETDSSLKKKFLKMFQTLEKNEGCPILESWGSGIAHCPSLKEIEALFKSGKDTTLISLNKPQKFVLLGNLDLDFIKTKKIVSVKLTDLLYQYCSSFFEKGEELLIGLESMCCLLKSNCVLFRPPGIPNSKFKLFCSDLNHIFEKVVGQKKRIKKCSEHNPTEKCSLLLSSDEVKKSIIKTNNPYKVKRGMNGSEIFNYYEERKREKASSRRITGEVRVVEKKEEMGELDRECIKEISKLLLYKGEEVLSSLSLLDKMKTLVESLNKLNSEIDNLAKKEGESGPEFSMDLPEGDEIVKLSESEIRAYDSTCKYQFHYWVIEAIPLYMEGPFKLSGKERKSMIRIEKELLKNNKTLLDHHLEGKSKILNWYQSFARESIRKNEESEETKSKSLVKKREELIASVGKLMGDTCNCSYTELNYRNNLFFLKMIKDKKDLKGVKNYLEKSQKEVRELINTSLDWGVFIKNVEGFLEQGESLDQLYKKVSGEIGVTKQASKGEVQLEMTEIDQNLLLGKLARRSCKKMNSILKKTSLNSLYKSLNKDYEKRVMQKVNCEKIKMESIVIPPNGLNKKEIKITSSLCKELRFRFSLDRDNRNKSEGESELSNLVSRIKSMTENRIINFSISIQKEKDNKSCKDI